MISFIMGSLELKITPANICYTMRNLCFAVTLTREQSALRCMLTFSKPGCLLMYYPKHVTARNVVSECVSGCFIWELPVLRALK